MSAQRNSREPRKPQLRDTRFGIGRCNGRTVQIELEVTRGTHRASLIVGIVTVVIVAVAIAIAIAVARG